MIDQYIKICIWRSGESTRLSQMWPGFKSQRRFHMWAEFIAGSLPCSERFFAGYSGSPPPPQKKTRHFQIPVTPVMVVKRFSIFFFSNGRITFIKFEGCFLKGQIHSNGFKIPKCCIVKCLNFIAPFEKKKNRDSFLFRKRFDWTIFFQEAWFQCPYCKSLFMVI